MSTTIMKTEQSTCEYIVPLDGTSPNTIADMFNAFLSAESPQGSDIKKRQTEIANELRKQFVGMKAEDAKSILDTVIGSLYDNVVVHEEVVRRKPEIRSTANLHT